MPMLIIYSDGVYTMAKDPESLERFASGSGDGVVKVWYVNSNLSKDIVVGLASSLVTYKQTSMLI